MLGTEEQSVVPEAQFVSTELQEVLSELCVWLCSLELLWLCHLVKKLWKKVSLQLD